MFNLNLQRLSAEMGHFFFMSQNLKKFYTYTWRCIFKGDLTLLQLNVKSCMDLDLSLSLIRCKNRKPGSGATCTSKASLSAYEYK